MWGLRAGRKTSCSVSVLDIRVPFQDGGWFYASGVRGQACVEDKIMEVPCVHVIFTSVSLCSEGRQCLELG